MIDQYGADALRFTLAAMAAQGRDIKLSTQRVEGYRNFVTKLWNACRFAEMNDCVTVPGFDPMSVRETLNRWIGHETARATREITDAIEGYRFNEAAGAAYRFVWNVFCDWYLELAKPVLQGPDGPAKDETRAMTAWVRDEILKLLHPFMPFVTEELWRTTAVGERDALLALTQWSNLSEVEKAFLDVDMQVALDVVSELRSIRTTFNIPTKEKLSSTALNFNATNTATLTANTSSIDRLANTTITILQPADTQNLAREARNISGSIMIPIREGEVAIGLPSSFNLAAEKARLEKEMARVEADIARIDAKLANTDFLRRAPEEVVEDEREKREESETRRRKIKEALERLKGAA
jgi:valyl-tRNA synthetase